MAHLGTSLHLGHGAVRTFAGFRGSYTHGVWGAALALAMHLGPQRQSTTKDGSDNASPDTKHPQYVVIGSISYSRMGFNPGSTLGATELRIGSSRVKHVLAGASASSWPMGTHQLQYGKARESRRRVQRMLAASCDPASCAFVATMGCGNHRRGRGACSVVYKRRSRDRPPTSI